MEFIYKSKKWHSPKKIESAKPGSGFRVLTYKTQEDKIKVSEFAGSDAAGEKILIKPCPRFISSLPMMDLFAKRSGSKVTVGQMEPFPKRATLLTRTLALLLPTSTGKIRRLKSSSFARGVGSSTGSV